MNAKRPRLVASERVAQRGRGVPEGFANQRGGSYPCPACQHGKSTVYDSRPEHGSVKRRRSCRACGHRWVTWESEGLLPAREASTAAAVVADLRGLADKIERLFLAPPDADDEGGSGAL